MASVQKVLLIDDDEIVNSINRVIINHARFADDIRTITEASDALSFIREEENPENLPDIIFLDLNMPDMDGWDFVEAFDELNLEKTIKIVMLTSSISQADQKKADSYETICAFLSKPLSPELLQNLEQEKLSFLP